ncbi:LPD1 domain-containing protein [Acinetobacter gandensis]|uniref:LPD1 domain-containing protein n=1 Tax=Acinetobacter gandensis TaxID=1443941 RepID=UPI00398A34FE
MSVQKKWLDLSRFGAQLVVTPKTDIRSQVALIKITDPKLLETSLNKPLNTFLRSLKESNKFIFVNNEYSDELSFMYKPSNENLSLTDIKAFFPYDKNNDLVAMDLSDIYLNNPMSSAEKNQWQSIFELNNQKNIQLYKTKLDRNYSPNLSILEALDGFTKADLGWNKIPLMLHAIDPLPLNDLDQYGYKANTALVRYFVDKESAIGSGFKEEDIEPVTLKNQLVISVNSNGEVLALRDITQIPELTNYNISNHEGWSAYNSLPQQYFDIRELNKTINSEIDAVVVDLRSTDYSVQQQGLVKFQAFISRINDCMYSIEENSVSSVIAPFGIETNALQNVNNEWKVWEYNNQTLEVVEHDIQEKIDALVKSVQTNINYLRMFDPYSVNDNSFDRELISESLSDIGNSLSNINFDELKHSLPPEPKVPVIGLKPKIDRFINNSKIKTKVPESILKDSIIKLVLMRRIKNDYLHKLAKLKEERQSLKESKTSHQINERLEKAVAIKVENDNAYVLDLQKYEDDAYELELSLSQLSIASTRLNNVYDTFFDAIIDKELQGGELNNFLHSVITDQDLSDELQKLLDDYNEFQATTTSNNIEIYQFAPDISEEPNYLWNEAVNEFDVLHYYDEEADIQASKDLEYSILGFYPEDQPVQPEFDEVLFSNSISVLENSIEELILSNAENVGKNYYTFQESLPRILLQLHRINSQFISLSNSDNDLIAQQYLSVDNLNRFKNLLEQDGGYKGFNKRIDVAHVFMDLTRNLGKEENSPIAAQVQKLRTHLNTAINDELRMRTNTSNSLANAIAFVATNEVLGLKDVLNNDEVYVINKTQNYIPKVISSSNINDNVQEQLYAVNKKAAVSMAYKRYLQDFYHNAVGVESQTEEVKSIINSEHKHILTALGYLTPTYNEVTATRNSNIENVLALTDEAVKIYLAEGSSLHQEEERNFRSLAVYSSTVSSDQNFIRLLPMDLGQKVNAIQKQKTIMTNGLSSYDHILSSNPISQDKLNLEQLKTAILSRILVKEAVPKYEKGLKVDLAVKNVYENTSRFLPLEQVAFELKNDFGSLFKTESCITQLQTTPDSIKPISSFNQEILNASLLQSFESRGAKFWQDLVSKSQSYSPAKLLNIVHHPDKIKEFEFPELDLYITLSPATDNKHGSVNLYVSGERIPVNDHLIIKSSLNELAAEDKKIYKTLSFNEDSGLSTTDQIQFIIDALDKKYQIFNTIQDIDNKNNVLFNKELADYKKVSLQDEEGRFFNPNAKNNLLSFIDKREISTYVDLMNAFTDYIHSQEDKLDGLSNKKIILANDDNELAISVLDKSLPVLQNAKLRVFDNIEQLASYNERGHLFKEFHLNAIKTLIVEKTLSDLDLDTNILQPLSAPLSENFDKIELDGLNEIISANLSSLVNKIDVSFGEKLLESKDRFDLAIRIADTHSPLKMVLVNNTDHDKYLVNGYKIIQTPLHPSTKNYSLIDFAKNFKKASLFNNRDLIYLPEHIADKDKTKESSKSNDEAKIEISNDEQQNANIEQQNLFENEVVVQDKSSTPRSTTQIETDLIEDTGMKMPGAKKDLYGPRLSLSQIQDMSLLQVQNLITREKIWKKESLLQAKESGRDIYIYLLTDAVRKTTNEQPRYPLENATEDQFKKVGAGYYDAVISIRDSLLEAKNIRDFIPKAAELYIRIQEDQDLLNAYKSLDKTLFNLIESYAEYAMADFILQREIKNTDSEETKNTMSTALRQLRSELPPVKGTFALYKKMRSAIDAKPFQSKINKEVEFRGYQIINNDCLFSKYDPALSEKVMDLLTAKQEKVKSLEKDSSNDVSVSDMTSYQIINETSNSLDTIFKNYAKPRTLRKAFKLSDVVVTQNIGSRNGKDISAHTLQATFGFKAVEFGEYLNQTDRQNALNYAYDGCFALAKALDIDPKFVGFNGMLGVAFGSRGKSAAMAHYEPSNRVINLTKNSGYGSFGHEFFHAYDHLIFSAMTRDKPNLLMENVQPFLTRFAQLNKVESEKYKDIDQDLLKAAVKVNEAMYYLPVNKDNTLAEIRTTLEQQVKYYQDSIHNILNNTLKDQPEIIDLFTAKLPNIKENINTFIAERGKLHTELRTLVKFAHVHKDPEEFQKDALKHRRYNNVGVGLAKFLSENEYPIPRTELNKYISQSRSDIDHERTFAAQVLGAANSNVFRTIVYREHRQLIRSQFALCALDFINEYSNEPIPEDHQKFIALSLQTSENVRSLDQTLKTNFFKNALVLEGLANKKKPYWTTAHEMFARSGEQYLQVTLAEMNLRNDWLVYPCPENSSSAITQPHGVEKDEIIREIRNFTVKGLDYIQENIAELRFADHQQYVKNAMHFFQPGTEQHDNLLKWNEVLNDMSQAEYDEYWTKLMTNIESQADPELSKQTNNDNELIA